VSTGSLSQIERGVVYPSLQSLKIIATALPAKVYYLLKEETHQRAGTIVKRNRREKFF